jgi:hypothetical protein
MLDLQDTGRKAAPTSWSVAGPKCAAICVLPLTLLPLLALCPAAYPFVTALAVSPAPWWA